MVNPSTIDLVNLVTIYQMSSYVGINYLTPVPHFLISLGQKCVLIINTILLQEKVCEHFGITWISA